VRGSSPSRARATILSEDLADGSLLHGVRILNPFAGTALTPAAAVLLATE
jgi:hypothetical protein